MLTLIVEGKGEEYALPHLIKKAATNRLLPGLPNIQYIVANGKPYILQYDAQRPIGLEGYVKRYAKQSKCFIILLDSDRTFPPYLQNQNAHDLSREYADLPARADAAAQQYGVSVVVCWAQWELESWLIGGLRKGEITCDKDLGYFSIRFAIPQDTTHNPRDAKLWLLRQFSKRKEEHYTPSVVECLAMHVRIDEAQRRNPTLQNFFSVLTAMAEC